jgi:hypothetical protein
MASRPDDLSAIEVALLGVLSVGLPPSRSAGDDTFHVDHVTAAVVGLGAAGRRELHLAPDGVTVTAAFREELRSAVAALEEKGIIAAQAAGMPAAVGGYEAGVQLDLVNPDEHPVLLDRYLGQLCMEKLFNIPAVYPFLMERYARSGEVWRRLREEGYGA